MQPISNILMQSRSPVERSPGRSDFARYLESAEEPPPRAPESHAKAPERHPADRPEAHAERKPDQKPTEPVQEKTVVKPEEVALPPLPLLQQELAVLLPQEPLPAAPELPEELQITVHLGAMPAGPRTRLDTPPEAPPQQKSLPPQGVEAPAPEVPPEAPEVVLSAEAPAPPEEEPQPLPTLQTSTFRAEPLPQARVEAPPVPAEHAEIPELPAPLPAGLNLEIKDPVGRWELGVVRAENTVHLEFHGNPELRKIVEEGTKEIGERLSRHGDALGSVQWRPIASTPTAQDGRMDQQGDRQRQAPEQQSQQQQQKPPERPILPTKNPTSRRALRVI